MAHFEGTVATDRPSDELFAYMADIRNFTSWDPGTNDVTQVEGEGPREGAEYRVEVAAGLRTMVVPYTMTTYDEPKRVVLRGRNRWMALRGDTTVSPDDHGSRVTYDAEKLSVRSECSIRSSTACSTGPVSGRPTAWRRLSTENGSHRDPLCSRRGDRPMTTYEPNPEVRPTGEEAAEFVDDPPDREPRRVGRSHETTDGRTAVARRRPGARPAQRGGTRMADGFEMLEQEHRVLERAFETHRVDEEGTVVREPSPTSSRGTRSSRRLLPYPALRNWVDGGDDLADRAQQQHAADRHDGVRAVSSR